MDLTKNPTLPRTGNGHHRVGDLIHRISDDAKAIVRDEIAIAKLEATKGARLAAADAAAVLLGGIVALIGLGLLCVAAVVALAPLIPALWLRLVLMAAVYLLLGGAVAAWYAKRLSRHVPPDAPIARREARRTLSSLRQEVSHA